MNYLTKQQHTNMCDKEIPVFRTPCQTEREQRDIAVYNDWVELTSVEGQSKTVVTEHLMTKYNIHSPGTIYVIRQRVEARLAAEKESKGGDQ